MVNYYNELDRTFAALADPTRRAILAQLESQDSASVSELARPFAIKLPAAMKHLDVLDEVEGGAARDGAALLGTHQGSDELAPPLRALLVRQP